MKILSYFLLLIVRLIVLAIVLTMFSRFSDPFETIVVALLMLIYLSISSWEVSSDRKQFEHEIIQDNQFIRLVGLLKDPEFEKLIEATEEKAKLYEKTTTLYYIRIAIDFLIWILVVLKITLVLF